MSWQLRHEGSPKTIRDLTLERIVEGLRDGVFDSTDEVKGPQDAAWQAIENHPQLAETAAELEAPPPRRHEEPTSLDMNALIDVCLVLLIFFILTTTYAAAVQKVVPLPTVKMDGKGARKVSVADVKNRMIRVQASLEADGRPLVRIENQTVQAATADGKSIDVDKLRDALQTYVRGQEKKTEILLDARDISWGAVIAIQDAAKAAGVHTIHHLLKK